MTRKKVLFIFRNNWVYDLVKASPGEEPTEFLWGMNTVDTERYDVRHVVAPRLEKRRGVRLLLWPIDFLFARMIKIGCPVEIYPLFKKEIDWADEIVCVNDQISLGVLFWRLFGRMKKQKIHCVIMSLQERIKFFPKNRFMISVIGMLLRKADTLLTLTDAVHEDFHQQYDLQDARMQTLYFGTDTSFWKTDPTAQRKQFVLSVGNDMNRDFQTLVDALPEDVSLTLVTKKQIDAHGKKVQTLSGISNEELRTLYQTAAAVVVPSTFVKNESPGLSCALQAMACGAPLILSDARTHREMFDDGTHCLFYPAGDVSALRELLKKTLADAEKRDQLGEQGSAWVTQKFTHTRMGEQLGALFQS